MGTAGTSRSSSGRPPNQLRRFFVPSCDFGLGKEIPRLFLRSLLSPASCCGVVSDDETGSAVTWLPDLLCEAPVAYRGAAVKLDAFSLGAFPSSAAKKETSPMFYHNGKRLVWTMYRQEPLLQYQVRQED